jgi:nucleoside-diphosphate-sugar epimerase
MHIFVTGGSGQTGPAIVSELIANGHSVTGLARSEKSVSRLAGIGAQTLHGSLDDLAVLAKGARASDGVVHMAFGGEFSDPASMTRRDCAAIDAMGKALTGSGKPLVITSGTLVMTTGKVATEQDATDPQSLGALRIPGERACLGFADKGVRSIVLRLAPTVHGPGDVGFIPFLISTARRTGISAYIDDGANRWPAVHRQDAATLYRLAVEKAPAGGALHGTGESGITFVTIAHLIGRMLNIRTVSVPANTAVEHFRNAFFAKAFAIDSPVSSTYTRGLLGWDPVYPTLLEDLGKGDYFSPEAVSAFDKAAH